MGTGILICGLNGCGKSTLGIALAQELNYHFIDNEYLFFSRKETKQPYTNPRSHEEAKSLFSHEINEHPNFVFSAVIGNYCENVNELYQCIVYITAPKAVRSTRVRQRSFQKFGARMLPGGDLYEAEEAFFAFAENRSEEYVENWLKNVKCPLIRVDGTKPIKENIAYIKHWLSGTGSFK